MALEMDQNSTTRVRLCLHVGRACVRAYQNAVSVPWTSTWDGCWAVVRRARGKHYLAKHFDSAFFRFLHWHSAGAFSFDAGSSAFLSDGARLPAFPIPAPLGASTRLRRPKCCLSLSLTDGPMSRPLRLESRRYTVALSG